MKIGVISDTHIPAAAPGLADEICEHFKTCDFIVHAGDVVEMALIEELRSIADTYAVYGNMDSYAVKRALPEKLVFEAEGMSIGVIHGRGAPSKVIRTVRNDFKDKELDIIIFANI